MPVLAPRRSIVVRRQLDLEAPAFAGLPAGFAQVIGGGAQSRCGVVDDVAAAAVEVDGQMNWVWPKAPAQDPLSFSRGMSPRSAIFSAAINSPRKYCGRREFEQARVVKDCTSGHFPVSWPKSDSTPQIAAMA